MNKKALTSILILLLLVGLTSCSNKAEIESSVSEGSSTENSIKIITADKVEETAIEHDPAEPLIVEDGRIMGEVGDFKINAAVLCPKDIREKEYSLYKGKKIYQTFNTSSFLPSSWELLRKDDTTAGTYCYYKDPEDGRKYIAPEADDWFACSEINDDGYSKHSMESSIGIYGGMEDYTFDTLDSVRYSDDADIGYSDYIEDIGFDSQSNVLEYDTPIDVCGYERLLIYRQSIDGAPLLFSDTNLRLYWSDELEGEHLRVAYFAVADKGDYSYVMRAGCDHGWDAFTDFKSTENKGTIMMPEEWLPEETPAIGKLFLCGEKDKEIYMVEFGYIPLFEFDSRSSFDVEVDIPDECWFVPVWSVSIRYKVRDFETNEEKPGTYTCLINAFTGEPLWRTEY